MKQRLTGLAALLVLLGVMIGMPWMLFTLGWGNLPSGWAGWQVLFSRPDDGTLLIGLVKLAGLVCWLTLAVAIVVELVAVLRGIPAPKLPGFGWSQLPARQLVAAAALLFVLPTAIVSVRPPQATAVGPTSPHHVATPTEVHQAPHKTLANKAAKEAAVRTHVVQPGESLWSIAKELLGDGDRYPELVRLNSKLVGADPDLIRPGWRLKVPAASAADTTTTSGSQPRSYVVKAGDTLSSIAEKYLGAPDRYDQIFRASRHITQPGGKRLNDPDVIDVGWRLTIPGTGHQQPKTTPQSDKSDSRPTTQTPRPPTTPQQTSTSPTANRTAPAATSAPRPAQDAAQGATSTAPWLLTGLVGSGLVLGGSMYMLLRRRRQAQFRARRPGRAVAAPPPVVAPVEKTIISHGAAAQPTVAFVDHALRGLAATMTAAAEPMPVLRAVELRHGALVLHLDQAAALAHPWKQNAERSWELVTGVELPTADANLPAPYPQLVSIGADDHGHLWLANLEQLGVMSLAGDATHSQDFARYLVAEMAINPWSTLVQVDCIGIAAEAAALNPARVRYHVEQDPVVAERVADAVAMVDRSQTANKDVATGRAGDFGDDVWPTWLVIAADADPAEPLRQLLALAAAHRGTSGTAVVILNDAVEASGTVVKFSSQGRLHIPQWDLELIPVGLTSDEAQGCATLIAACDQPDTPMPNDDANEGWQEYASVAGAIRNDLVVPRHVPATGLLEPASTMLPGQDADLVKIAATTVEDLDQLAPWVPQRICDQVEAADPGLDVDLADWLAAAPSRPRLWLLGPITARVAAGGNPSAAARRRAFYTELWAYLALRPGGATIDETAEAFNLEATQIRKHMGVLRDWLGKDANGNKHLPDAKDSKAGKARGIGVYQLDGAQLDLDLFRRLRVRGQARGAQGIEDLRTALSLVTGEPFGGQRGRGWAWLVDGDRIDQHMVCSIIDVAHLVVAADLHAGNIAQARAAAEIAAKAAPYGDQPKLDLAAVLAAEGKPDEAARMIDHDITNRTDNPDEAPQDLSERSAALARKARWLNRARVA